jgi:membrane protein
MRERSQLPEVGSQEEQRAPEEPTDLPRRAWPGILRRTLREYKADNLGDLAAALTYYGVLAIFPMLIVLVSLLGVTQVFVTPLRVAPYVDSRRWKNDR